MGGRSEPTVTKAPTKTSQQQEFLASLLSFFPQAMKGQTIGEAYGGPGQANYSPIKIGEGKNRTPTGRGDGPRGNRPNSGSSPLDVALTGPIVNPSRQLQTGNFPRRGGG